MMSTDYEYMVRCALSARRSAHEYLHEADAFKAQGKMVWFHRKMAQFYRRIADAIFAIRQARDCKIREKKQMESAE